MYRILRNVHLGVGLFFTATLFAYGLSAAQMAYPVVRPTSSTSDSTIDVPAGVDTAPRSLARWLMTTHDLRGDLTAARQSDGEVALTITRPGTVHEIRLDEETRRAQMSTRVQDAVGMFNRLHHVRGVAHDYWAINAWGWIVFAASLGLLVLACTGTVMWFQRHRDSLAGRIIFAIGLAGGLTLLILVRLA